MTSDRTGLRFLAFVAATVPALHTLADDRISTARTAADEYELTLESTTIYDVETAQRLLIPAMRQACGDKYVEPGRYRFESHEPVAGQQDQEIEFKLVQQIRCVDEMPAVAQPAREPMLRNEKALRGAESRVLDISQAYFRSLYANVGNDAAAAINGVFARRESNDQADVDESQPTVPGTPVEINVHKITIYDNPPNAQQPGVYIAADYQNSVGNVAYHCGYLMWYSEDGSDYSLWRVESGVVSDAEMLNIPQDQLRKVLEQMRCTGEPAR